MKGLTRKNTKGLITRKLMMASLYQSGDAPRKFFTNAERIVISMLVFAKP